MTDLEQQIQVVARAREAAKEAVERRAVAKTLWELEHKELFTKADEAEAIRNTEEAKLRAMTLEAYEQTKNKAPAPGVGIRIVTELVYNPEQAFDWAKSHYMALKLDTSAFEKIAKAAPMEFVKTVEKPTATIATQLDIIEERK